MKDHKEKWKDVDGFSGHYRVSNRGVVISLKSGVEIVRKPYINPHCGYAYIDLYMNNQKTSFRRCRLVATHFIPNPQNKPEVNHIDGIKTNDSHINLEWVTPRENMSHAVNMGLHDSKGSKNPMSKLRKSDVIEIKKRLRNGETHSSIADDYNVGRKAITKIKNKQRWGWV